ncbi:uracil DNA glycosylase superfamily protein [Fontibacillus phaseoli]|uniref:Uracil DNA glycosylase superfamily protein n=1 Tax=Fontibacillus phaseoli TaxID=1416533 RepID=A0A369BIU4_9BACL|nr:uracil-DNA glycosylase family protein [Fontibacillus phaseoli]RCX21509.1 uracil DNA glycosylase superfamily protein [Fontibacillus phaseoli]
MKDYFTCETSCKDVNLEVHTSMASIQNTNVKVLMISEALPKDINDYFYTTEEASFFKSTCQALEDAGYHVNSINELSNLGIYLTTALKCSKKNYLVSATTIKNCSRILEQEIDPFKNVKSIMCMGDFAIKAVNYIYKKKYGSNVIPSGSTYKIRDREYILNGIRFYPSYTQTGDSFNIEKSKRMMIAEDIRSAFEYAGIRP